jgi:trk system potassium uptake protein TrkA
MSKVAVIGLGRFGQELARVLSGYGVEVIAIDRNSALVESMRDQVTLAVCLDSTDEEALKAQGVDQVDVAVVGIGEHFESAALTVALLKSLKVNRIISRAESDIQARILRKVGADEIANPEHEAANRWAHRLTLPRIREYVELGEGFSMIHVDAPSAFCGKTPKALMLRNQYGINLIAISRPQKIPTDEEGAAAVRSSIIVPDPDTKILDGDVLILVGSNEGLSKLPRD